MSTANTAQVAQRMAGRLVAVLRDEVAAQERILELLERQESQVVAPSSEGFSAATEALEAELQRAPHRAQKRGKALSGLASAFGVSAQAMTLTSLVERLGAAPQAAAIAAERDRLAENAAHIQRRVRRVGALVRMHREVTRDLVQLILGSGEDGEDVRQGGTLIDAEV